MVPGVGDRPEGAVEPQAVTEDDGELVRVGDGRPEVPDAEPPAVGGVGVAVGAGPKVGRGGVPGPSSRGRGPSPAASRAASRARPRPLPQSNRGVTPGILSLGRPPPRHGHGRRILTQPRSSGNGDWPSGAINEPRGTQNLRGTGKVFRQRSSPPGRTTCRRGHRRGDTSVPRETWAVLGEAPRRVSARCQPVRNSVRSSVRQSPRRARRGGPRPGEPETTPPGGRPTPGPGRHDRERRSARDGPSRSRGLVDGRRANFARPG